MKKHHRKLLSLASLLLVFTLLFTGCDVKQILGIRRTIPFSEMPYTFSADEATQVIDLIKQGTADVKTAKNFLEILAIDDAISTAVNDYYTKSYVLEVHTYLDTTDDVLRDTHKEVSDNLTEISNLISKYNKAIIDSKFKDDYKIIIGEYSFNEMQDDLKLEKDEAVPLKQEREKLSIEYNKLSPKLSIDFNGKTYTIDDILSDDSLPYEDRYYMYSTIFAENSETFYDIYSQMIKLDTQRAKILGFDSAADMYYASYDRDYTPQDAKKYFEKVKTHLVPIYKEIEQYSGANYYVDKQSRPSTVKKIIDLLPQFDEKLLECYNFIEKYDLADIKSRKNKNADVAFTAQLVSFDAPFLYMSWDNTFNSTNTFIHEFGHCLEDYVLFENRSYCTMLDESEIFSQSLELLFQEYYDEFVPASQVKLLKKGQLTDFLGNSILYQAMLEEFQITAYENPEYTNDDLARLFQKLSKEYGVADENDPSEYDYSWYRISHFFDAPFYTISYCTSGSISLELFSMAQDDFEGTVDKYMEMMKTDREQEFSEYLEECEMTSPFDEKAFEKIEEIFNETFDIGEKSDTKDEDNIPNGGIAA